MVYGIDNPQSYQSDKFTFVKEHTMIPQKHIDELKGFEKFVFAKLYTGGFSKKLYRCDGFLALGIIVTYFVVMTISGIIVQYISQLQITIIGGGINVFFVVLVLLCLKMRHQGIETIGLKEGNIRLSFVLGGTLAAFLFFCNCYQMYCLSTNLLLILQIY